MIKEVLILPTFFFLFHIMSFGQGQYHYLEVPVLGQNNSNWCWAASMDMIDEFYGGSLNQCSFVETYPKVIIWRSQNQTISIPTIDDCCSLNCKDPSIESRCNNPLNYSKRDGKLNYHYADLILGLNGYNSQEDHHTNLINWDKIVSEINACRPFILFLSNTSLATEHVVVAKGFVEIFGSQYVLINDPLNDPTSCKGTEALIPISNFSDPISSNNSVRQTVRFIAPKDSVTCAKCDEDELKDANDHPLVQSILNNSNDNLLLILNNNDFSVSDQILNELTASTKYSSINYIYKQTINDETKNLKMVVINSREQSVVIFLEFFHQAWRVRRITNLENISFKPELSNLSIDGKKIDMTIKSEDYDIITFIPDYFKYYKINYQAKEYLVPFENYPMLDLDSNSLYSESNVKKRMKNIVDKRKENTESILNPEKFTKSRTKEPGFWPFRWLFKLFSNKNVID